MKEIPKFKYYASQNRTPIVDGYDNGVSINKKSYETIKSILKHKNSVKNKLNFLSNEIKKRGEKHDDSKLKSPEIDWLIQMDQEQKYPYGSQEYFDKVKRWGCFFNHHYKENRHHPDHFLNGVCDMNLIDLVEYLTDIISYCEEMHVDDAIKTVESQQERFKLDNQLTQILKNTLFDFFTWFGDNSPKALTSDTSA